MTLGNYVGYYKIIKTIQSDSNYQMYPNSHDICGIKSYMHFIFNVAKYIPRLYTTILTREV